MVKHKKLARFFKRCKGVLYSSKLKKEKVMLSLWMQAHKSAHITKFYLILQHCFKLPNLLRFGNLVFFKTKNTHFTVLKSPHVNKKHREQFIYSRKSASFQIAFKSLKVASLILLKFFRKYAPAGCALRFNQTFKAHHYYYYVK